MNKTTAILFPLFVMMLLLCASAVRAENDETRLAQSNLHLDYKAEKTGWPTVVFDQLQREFGVSQTMIYALREQNLSYSEMSAVLSLAEQMPGGITDRNIEKVVHLHRAGDDQTGWGKLAKTLKVSLSRVINHVNAINETSWSSADPELVNHRLDVRGKDNPWRDSDHANTLPAVPRLSDGLPPGH